MPKLRLIKDDPSLQDIIPFPGPIGGRLGARVSGAGSGGSGNGAERLLGAPGRGAEGPSREFGRDFESQLLGTIDRMKEQLDELSGMLDPIPLYPRDDRPTAA